MIKIKKCHTCGSSWEGSPGAQPGRSESCARCGADIHCCSNCRLYDPSAPNGCVSRTVDPVKDKERGNYCDEFDMGSSEGEEGLLPEEIKNKWNDLFK